MSVINEPERVLNVTRHSGHWTKHCLTGVYSRFDRLVYKKPGFLYVLPSLYDKALFASLYTYS